MLTVSRLQEQYGRCRWRWRAPLRDHLDLKLITADFPITQPLLGDSLSSRDRELVEAATAVLSQAADHGIAVTQAALGRQLRADGYAIGNDRLRWLMTAARAGLASKTDA